MALKVAKRAAVAPFIVMEVMRDAAAREAAGGDVLHLEVGQPSTPAPSSVLAAATKALATEGLGYTVALGIDPLRAAIAEHYCDRYGVAVPAERVAVTTGSSGAFLLAFLACFDVGDRVAMAEPGYPCYRNILSGLGITPVPLAVDSASNFQPTPAMIESLGEPIDGLIVASPANPTGTMLRAADLAALAAVCRARGIRLISDEIYHGITYGKQATTALATSDEAVVINSFSKYFSMTGWRLGWMVVPDELLRAVERLAQNLFISPPTLAQHAAVAAFGCREELDANVARYALNREILLDELPRAGLDRLSRADGAFYIYADVSRFTNDSDEFCRRVLAQIGVAITPGGDFDPRRGHAFVRFSFAGATADMREAARRLRGWLDR